jgi:hypothetical protein
LYALTPEPTSVDGLQATPISLQFTGAALTEGTVGGTVSPASVVAPATVEYFDAPFRENTRTR